MKTTWLVFLTISGAAFMQGTGYAAPSQQASAQSSANTASTHPGDAGHAAPAAGGKPEKDGNPSGEQRNPRHDSDKNPPRSRASLPKANPPQQVPNKGERATSENAKNLHQLGGDKSAGVTKGESIQHEKVNGTLIARPSKVIRPTVPLLNNLRHLGANPAVIGGPAHSGGWNSEAINGTNVHRRP
jgi:hypothetical protein